MQGNRENENNLTRNEGGLPGEPRESTPQFRSMQTARDAAVMNPMTALGYGGKDMSASGASTPSKNGKWVFHNAKPLPFFGLERAVEIMFNAHIIAARICDSLRLRSVHAKYNESEAICTTSSYLTYAINLYDDNQGNTLIEVIRIDGCGFEFRREREAVINAAQGKGGIPQSNLPMMMKVPEELLKTFKAPTEREHEDTLLRATEQLHISKYDVQLFVLKNLAAITSSDKVNQESAQIMSRLLLKNTSDVRALIVNILGNGLEDYNERNVEMINACLAIFSNSFALLSDLKLLETILIDSDASGDFTESIIPLLIKIVSTCKCPHNSCIALRCLILLFQNSSIAQETLNEESTKYLKDAEKFGRQRHMRLQLEAQALMKVLG